MEIDYNKLSRDYIKEPLKKTESLTEDDLYYLYIELNLSTANIGKLFNKNPQTVLSWCNKYKIVKSKEMAVISRKNTMLEKFGADNAMKVPELLEKHHQSVFNSLGVCIPAKSKNVIEKMKQTCMLNHSVENPSKSKTIISKQKETSKRNHNGIHHNADPECIKKKQETNRQKYGVKNAIQNPLIRERYLDSLNKNFKTTQRVVSPFSIPKVKQKIIDKIPQSLVKSNDTKRKNNSFNKSIPEDICYRKLSEKYNDVKRQYRSDLYPFACDFYIPSLDLYIECNFTWTHGGVPYIEEDEYCINQLNKWQEKAIESTFYGNAIYTWTDLDVRKRNTAEENGLNYLVFYKPEEFDKWLNQ